VIYVALLAKSKTQHANPFPRSCYGKQQAVTIPVVVRVNDEIELAGFV
jgi:hypothetical protein